MSSTASSSNLPPPVVAQTLTDNQSLLANNNNNNTTTTTTTSSSSPQQQEQQHRASKQTSIQLRNARPQNENPVHWLQRIRTVQISSMTPEQREQIRHKAEEQQERYAKAKKLHAISHRTQNAKTTSYYAMDQNAVHRDRQSQVANFGSVIAPSAPGSAPPNFGANNNNNNNNLLPPPPPPSSANVHSVTSAQAKALMKQMEDDDELIANSFSAPISRKKKSGDKKEAGGQQQQQQQDEKEDARQEQLQRAFAAMPVSAAREEKQMTTSYAWNQNQDAERERVTETEEQTALRGLRVEPKTDDERAAKFEVFEKFSNKMMKIRKDLDETIEETVIELPPLPREGVKQSMKKLESDNCRGIYDQSRYWFVHDMFLQVSKNCDLMNSISDEIARKIRLVATNSQTECPICLLTFADENNNNNNNFDDDDDDEQKKKDQNDEEEKEPKVPAMLLSCCHKVCEECWDQWCKLKEARVYCPLCRNEEFLKEVAAGQE